MFQVSIYIGNLTWWTSDLDIEQHIRKNGITDLVEVSTKPCNFLQIKMMFDFIISIQIKIYENSSNGQSKGFALVHLGSESSAKLLMEKFPKIELNGQKPIVTPANENTLQQFENVVKKQRKNSGSKHENNSSAPSNPIGKIVIF